MLNPHDTIMLIGVHDAQRVLVGFHPEPGNYLMYLPPGVAAEPGSQWEFFCPVCDHSLETSLSADLCEIHMHNREEEHRVFFSRTAGRQATFVVSAEGLRSRHGAHADDYEACLPHLKYVL
jgi:hypothetical protein